MIFDTDKHYRQIPLLEVVKLTPEPLGTGPAKALQSGPFARFGRA